MEDQMQQALVAAMRDDPRPQWKQTAGDIFDSVFDFIMGGAGVPGTPDSKSKQWGELLSAAVPVLGGVRAIKAIKPIKAYHGSPHDFDQFSLSKIGTGEGAQAYGHGLYFADSEGVARSYRDALSDADWSINGAPYNAQNPEHFAAATLAEYPDASTAIKNLRAQIAQDQQIKADWVQQSVAQKRDVLRRIEAGNLPKLDEKVKGRMYEVNIHADPDDFLDWDAPLSQQAPKVREALDRAYRETAMVHPSKAATPKTGAAIYDDMRVGVGGLETKAKAPASEYLKELGVPGIKYLDQGSRGNGSMLKKFQSESEALEFAKQQNANGGNAVAQPRPNGWVVVGEPARTRNYVVFDDKLISIVKKYGIAGAVSAGLISQAQAQQLQEQGIK